MSKFVEEGFLCTDMDETIKEVNSKYKEWVDIYESLNRYCFEVMSKLSKRGVHPHVRQEHLVAALFIRMISLYEGSYILMKQGMQSEAKIILRTMFEALFSLCAIAKDKELAEQFYQEHNNIKYQALKKLVDSENNWTSPEHKKLLADLETKRKVIKHLTVEDWSKKAGLHDFYTSTYPYFSWSSHSNIMEIGQSISGESDDSIDSISIRTNYNEAGEYFMTGIECIVIALKSVDEIFGLQEDIKIRKYDNSYRELAKKLL